MNVGVKRLSLRLNCNLLADFFNTRDYLTKHHRRVGNYDNSIAFKYIINKFNREFNNYPLEHWKYIIEINHSRLKKDTEIKLCVLKKPCNEFINNCNKLGIKKAKVIRSLMYIFIEENEREQVG